MLPMRTYPEDFNVKLPMESDGEDFFDNRETGINLCLRETKRLLDLPPDCQRFMLCLTPMDHGTITVKYARQRAVGKLYMGGIVEIEGLEVFITSSTREALERLGYSVGDTFTIWVEDIETDEDEIELEEDE